MQYGTVTGRFLAAVADTPADADLNPDVVPLSGSVTFTPSAAALKVAADGVTILPAPITGTLDSQGNLTLNGVHGVTLIATNTDDTNPRDFTYRVTFTNLKYGTVGVLYQPFSIAVPAGETIDLSVVAPVAEANGASIIRGERGEPGGTFTYDAADGFYTADDAAPIPSVDPNTQQFPSAVRSVLAANLADPSAPEGAVLQRSAPVLPQSTFAASKWFTALNRVRMGTGNAKILCVGDSTTAGFGATAAQSWPALVQQRLNMDVLTQPGLSIAMNLSVDTARWNLGGWINAFGPGGGALYANPGTGADAVFTPGVTVDTIDVWWFQGAGKGSFVVKIDGVAQTPVNTSGPSGAWQKTTYTVTAGVNHVVAFVLPTDNPVHVLGVDAYLSSRNSVRVANWGVSGSTSETWATAPYSLVGISSYAPDLTVVMLGINDANSNVTVANWRTNVTAIVNEAKKSGDVILMSVVPSGSSIISSEQQYRAATPALAASLDVGYIDLYAKVGGYSDATYADALHPNARGYANIARYVIAGLRSI